MSPVGPAFRFFLLLACVVAPAAPLHATANQPLRDAISLFDAHRLPEARDALVTLVGREPDNAQALWYLGQTDLLMKSCEDAVIRLQRAVALSPGDHRILADYGTACLLRASELGFSIKSIGYARKGRDALQEAVRLAPDVIAYREGLASFYKEAPAIVGGGVKKAYAQADEIAKRDPLRGTVIKATIMDREKKYDEARAACETVLRARPDCYLALYTLGRIASESGHDLERGERSLRRCLELTPAVQEPDFAGVHYRLGLIARQGGRTDEARAELKTALALEPTFQAAADALAKLDR